jgi:GT2 family glycosyltransferase
VRLIRNRANDGFGQGNNLGAREATGEYLVFVNQDATVEPGWLDALVGALQDEPRAGLATSKILQMNDPNEISACGLDLHYTGLALARGKGMGCDGFLQVEEIASVSGAAFAIRKDVFELLGGFDEDFFMYMEDVDLSIRARLAGYKVLYVPDSIVYHNYALRFGAKKTLYQERNRYLLLLKSLHWRTLLALLPAILLTEVVTWGFVLLRDRRHLFNKVLACISVAAHWDDVIEKRRQTEAFRQTSDHSWFSQCTHQLAYEQAGSGTVVRFARAVFDPLFYLFRRLALVLARC